MFLFSRREDTYGTGISETDLKTKLDAPTEFAASLEECSRCVFLLFIYLIYFMFIRFCSLGSGCDMFQYKATLTCQYFPHLRLKDKPLFELLTFSDNPKDAVYVLDCAAGIISL